MNVVVPLPMDRTALLAWAEGREGRYELARGRVAMMTGGSRGHAIVMRRLSLALERHLDTTKWTVLTSDFAVDVGADTIRYPDVVVDAAGGALRDLTATAPILIAEVVSPSSATDDLGDKAAEYLRLQNLRAYLVFAQDEPKAWIWLRGTTGFAAGADVIVGKDKIISIPALQIELSLSEIYQGIGAD